MNEYDILGIMVRARDTKLRHILFFPHRMWNLLR